MLRRLAIENIALISSQTIEFEEGFSVFTGETGAGKSLVIDSLALVLGARADRSLISYGQKIATVEAVFENLSEKTSQKLFEFGFDEEDTLILFRKIFDDGRNDCRVNGRSVTVSMLKELASTLVDVYGQFENQTMFKASNQLALVDLMAKNKKELLDLSDKLDKIAEIDKKIEECDIKMNRYKVTFLKSLVSDIVRESKPKRVIVEKPNKISKTTSGNMAEKGYNLFIDLLEKKCNEYKVEFIQLYVD